MGKGLMKGVSPFIKIFNILGILQNTVTERELKPPVWWTQFIFLCWMTAHVGYAIFFAILKFLFTDTTTPEKLDAISDLLIFVTVIADMLMTYLSQDLLIKFFKALMQYDEEVAKIRCSRQDNLRFCWAYWICDTLAIFAIIIVYLVEAFEAIIVPVLIAKIIGVLVQLSCSFKLIFLLYLTLQRFRHFNDLAQNICWTVTIYSSTTCSVKDIKFFHAILSNAVDCLNEIYANILVTYVAGLFVNILILVYEVVVETTLSIILSAIVFSIRIFAICAISHFTIEQGNRVGTSITSNTFNLLPREKILDKIEVMLYFLHNRLSFTAGGYFVVDFTLMQAIVSTTATYFMVLMQSV